MPDRSLPLQPNYLPPLNKDVQPASTLKPFFEPEEEAQLAKPS